MDDSEPVGCLAFLQLNKAVESLVPSQPQWQMQALVNTPVDSSSHVYLLQRVVEGLHVHVCDDTCTLEFKVDVHSIDVI